MVFGDRSVSAKYRRYRSAGSTTPVTLISVKDTALLAGSNTFDTCNAAPVTCLVDGQGANPSTNPVNYITDSSRRTKDIGRLWHATPAY
jgi:hypothetical protein